MSHRTALITRAAQLYYRQELNQAEIAQVLGVSRTTVSRLLSDARARRIVTIDIAQPVELNSELSKELRIGLGLRDALVVVSGLDDEMAMEMVGRAGAQLLESVVADGDTIAISWGRTLGRLADALSQDDDLDVEVVQMIGSLGEGDPTVDGPELARRFAERLGGGYRYVHAPAVVNTAELRAELAAQPQIKETLGKVEDASICITSVGSMLDPDSSLQRNGYLTEEERSDYVTRGAVGHLLAKIIDVDGNEFPDYNDRVLAVSLDQLVGRPWSICLGTGRAKAAAVLGATRAGYANAVVVDEDAATAIVELMG